MTETLPAIIQFIGLAKESQGSQQDIEVQIKLSTGEEHWVYLQPDHPLLTQSTQGEHVLSIPNGTAFAIATNYGNV